MAMNEYGEIVRPDNQSSSTSGKISSENSRSYDSFSSDVVNHFTAARKRNFNIITLLITIPFYAVIGYFTAEYFQYKDITNQIGAMIGAGAALICTLIYNNALAKQYGGYEYLISLLSAGIALGIVAAIIALVLIIIEIVKFVVKIVAAIFGFIVVIAILIGVFGG